MANSSKLSMGSLLALFSVEADESLENPVEYRRDGSYRFACLACVAGIVLGFFVFHLLLPRYGSMSPACKFVAGMLPYQVFGTGACLLALLPMLAKEGFRRTFDMAGKSGGARRRLLACALHVLLLYPCVMLANYLSGYVCSVFGISAEPQLVAELSEEGGTLFWVIACLFTLVVSPVSEEVMIRLVLYRTLRSFCPLWACLLSSFIFSIMHCNALYLPGLFIVGLFLQRARSVCGLQGSILLHCTYNLIALAGIGLGSLR